MAFAPRTTVSGKAPLRKVVALTLAGLSVAVGLTSCSGAPDDGALNELPSGSAECDTTRLLASSEKSALLAEIADGFNASSEGQGCTRVLVYSKASGAASEALAGWDEERDGTRPDAWTPASSSWLRLLDERTDGVGPAPLEGPSIMTSPLVVAMPEPMARSLGWPDAGVGWKDLFALATDPAGWGSLGHPEWGSFKLGKTNPELSTSGLHATIGAYYAATGLSSDLTSADVANPAVTDFVSSIEASAVHYGDTTLTFLGNMDRAAKEGRGLTYVSAVTLEEKSVLDYNSGNPSGDPRTASQGQEPDVKLVSVYPEEGTLVSDSPVVDLSWASAGAKRASAAFVEHVRQDDVQARVTQAGFRTFEGVAGPEATVANGVLSAAPVTLTPPSPAVTRDVLESWKSVRKGARVLFVVDTSGSMGGSKIDLARKALASGLEEFGPRDEVGLASFDDEYRVEVPVGPLSEQRTLLQDRVAALEESGGTALYRATIKGVDEVASLEPARTIDAVVVLSDGEDSGSGDLGEVVRALGGSDEVAPVKVFTIGYGGGADAEVLTRLAQASGGAYYPASDEATIGSVMRTVVSNF